MVKQILAAASAAANEKQMLQPVGPALPEKKSCIFYKLMVASIVQDKKLRIPRKFVKKYGHELSSIATLAVPSGRLWLVELKKDNKRMWFNCGWNLFVEYYSICSGYFLVFGYEGNSRFCVHVYDLTASEINYLPNSLNNLEEGSRGEHVNAIGNGDLAETSSSILTNKDFDKCRGHDRKKYESSIRGAGLRNLQQKNNLQNLHATFLSTQDKRVQFSEVELTSTTDETKRITKKLKQETEPIMDKHESLGKVEVTDELLATAPRNVSRRWRDVTGEEKQSAFRAAEMFKPENPYCRILLRPSYVYKRVLLHIPRWFAQSYLAEVDGDITLEGSEGKKWSVRCTCANGGMKFSKGWADFVLDNNLDEGDICVFELINTKEIVLKVTIFRVLEDDRTSEPMKLVLIGMAIVVDKVNVDDQLHL